jgi:hypothetical protein
VRNQVGRVAATGVLLLAGCASRNPLVGPGASGSSTDGPTAAAWVDRPAPAYVIPTPTPTVYPTDARPCQASDLTAVPGAIGAAGGTTNIRIEFTNRAGTGCVLLGYPTSVVGVAADGAATALDAGHGSIIGDQPWPAANIAPGQTAAVNISSSDECEAIQRDEHRVYPTLRIGLPSTDAINVASRGFDTICGVWASQFGVPAHAELPNEPTPSPLTARLTAPTTAQAGETFAYTVTLHNRSDTSYALAPCPAYEEYLGVAVRGATFVHENYYLNCDTVQQIPAGGEVTYQMRLQLPADLGGTGPAKFGWQIQGEAGPAVATEVEVTD